MEPWVSQWITPADCTKEEGKALAEWFKARDVEHVRMFRVVNDGFDVQAMRMLLNAEGKFYIREGSVTGRQVMTQLVDLERDDCPIPERYL